MAGGTVKFRHLSRDSAARQALLRGLVTQLVKYEHIHTTYAKAKEAQRLAEKLITHAKHNNEQHRRSAQGILYTPDQLLPKLFGELRERYQDRAGGYTRVTRTESKNPYDQGESAILEFVDGPKDSRFMMTAMTVARDRLLGQEHTPVTSINIKKVTRHRGEDKLEEMVQKLTEFRTGTSSPVVETKTIKDEGDTNAEKEAASLADEYQERAKHMADNIVPESVKQAALAQKKTQ